MPQQYKAVRFCNLRTMCCLSYQDHTESEIELSAVLKAIWSLGLTRMHKISSSGEKKIKNQSFTEAAACDF